MADFLSFPARLPSVESRAAIPNVQVTGNEAAFGTANAITTGQQAREMQAAGARLEQASDNLGAIALREQAVMNENRVQELNNDFIKQQQDLLYNGESAFFRQQGQNAIKAAPGTTKSLLDLKDGLLKQTANEWQKRRLQTILDGHVNEVTNSISRHVSIQSVEWQKQVMAGRQELIRQDAAIHSADVDKVQGLTSAAEENARAQAATMGVQGTDAEKVMVLEARSAVVDSAIRDQLIAKNNPRLALAMWTKYEPTLDAKTRDRLANTMKSVRDSVAGDDWITRRASGEALPPAVKEYWPLIQEAAAQHGLEPQLVAAVLATESGGVRTAVSKAGAGGLMQLMPGTAKDLGVKDVNDARENIFAGTRYLAQQLAANGGDVNKALIAYNWGPGNAGGWLKGGGNPEALPAETRGYVQKVQGYLKAQLVGADKADSEKLIQQASTDPTLTDGERNSIVTKLRKQSATVEAERTARMKGLDDLAETAGMMAIASPSSYQKGAFGKLQVAYAELGDTSKAFTMGILAANEDRLMSFASTPADEQKRVLQDMLSGKAKALATGIIAADEKGRAEAVRMAREDFAGLKKGVDEGLDVGKLRDKAKSVLDNAARSGDAALVREVSEYANAQLRAASISGAPQVWQQDALDRFRQETEKDPTNENIAVLGAMQRIVTQQAAEFAKDPVTAGAKVYDRPLPPLTDMRGRVAFAEDVQSKRGLPEISPFTDAEITDMRGKLSTGSAANNRALLTGIAQQVPARMIPAVGKALAGKGETDPLSRSYAAALSFYAEGDPQVGDQIMQGATLIRDSAEGNAKVPVNDIAWQQTLQDRLGNVFTDMGGGVEPTTKAAVAAIYAYQMHRAGRQGEKAVDTDVLDAAVKAVVGAPMTRKGQAFLPPRKDMTEYQVDDALRSLSDGDLEGVKTQEGDQVTAEAVYRRGMLTNAGKTGLYYVRIPDPRAGWDPRPLVRADGQPYVLDLRALDERARLFPPSIMGSGQKPTEPRRRPVPPTLNDVAP